MKSRFSHQKNQTVNCICNGPCNCGDKPATIKDQYSRGFGTSANLEILGDQFEKYEGD